MIVYPFDVLGNRVIVEPAEPFKTLSIHDAAVAFRRRGYAGYVEGNHWYVFQRASNGRSPKAYAILKTGEDCRYNGKPAVIMPREKPYHIKPRFVRVVDRWGAVVNNFRYPIPGLKSNAAPMTAKPDFPYQGLPHFPDGKEVTVHFFRFVSKNELVCKHPFDVVTVNSMRDVMRVRKARKAMYDIPYVLCMCRGVFYIFRNQFIQPSGIRRIIEEGTESFRDGKHQFVYRYPKPNAPMRFIRMFA